MVTTVGVMKFVQLVQTHVEKVIIIEILGNEYDFCEMCDSMVSVGLVAWMTLM